MNQDLNTGTATVVKVTPPVATPVYSRYYTTFLQAPSSTTDSVTQNLDDIFSEKEYMKLLDMLLDNENEDEKDEEEGDSKDYRRIR